MRKGITVHFVAAGLALAVVAARAQDQREQAMQAAFADGMTTAVGVAASAGAINPIGPLLATAMKAVTLHRASTLPETEQPAAYAAASAMWMGGTVSNICVTAIFLTGGGFAPVCLALGAAWGFKSWNDTEHERNFWERCAILRQFAVRQEIKCVYVPPAQQAAAQESAVKEATVQPVVLKHGASKQAVAKRTSRKHEPARPAPLPEPAPAPAPLFATPHEMEAP